MVQESAAPQPLRRPASTPGIVHPVLAHPVLAQPNLDRGFVARVSAIAGLGGILYGYDMGIIAAALIFVRGSFHLTPRMEEFVVSIVLVGAMLGALLGGTLADHIGRRATLIWAAGIFLAGSLLAPLAPNVGTLLVARLLLGFAIGFTSVTAPVYVSELAAPASRGRLIGLYQFALTLGIAIADLVGYALASSHGWRLMFGLGAVPAVIFALLVMTVPESPRWLVSRGRSAEAVTVLETYTDRLGAALLLAEIQSALRLSATADTRWRALLSPAVRGSLLLAVGFTILQQVTGINTVIYYGPQIFLLAGVASDKAAIFATLLVAIMNVLATVIALVLVDRAGRKPLLFCGVTGMALSLAILAASFAFLTGPRLGIIATICLMVYITAFAASMGPIAWILVAEVFPLRVRARGVAAASLGSGLSNFFVSLTFLSLLHAAGSAGTFALYTIACVLTLVFIAFVVPETRGRELESISAATTSATAL